MTDLLLDQLTGDLAIINGDLVLIATTEQLVRQQVEITLRTFRGEWKYNINFGPPYVANANNPIQILGKTQKNIFDLHMREAILSVEGVTSLDSYSSSVNFTSQIASVVFRASTSSGPIAETIEVTI